MKVLPPQGPVEVFWKPFAEGVAVSGWTVEVHRSSAADWALGAKVVSVPAPGPAVRPPPGHRGEHFSGGEWN